MINFKFRMNKYPLSISILIFVGLIIPSCNFDYRDDSYSNLLFINPSDTREDILFKAAHVIPTPRQLQWQQKELTAFLHFGMNTFTDVEWGNGKEDPKLFNPVQLDANQWVNVLKEAGFKQIILTAKHHDGFCLWPSGFTSHSVKNSLWKGGNGDVVKELADACVKLKMDLGIYLSPWDRHEQTYGSDEYNTYFKNQLRELLTNYGIITEVWFDGAVGEGPNGKTQIYDWQGYYDLVRELQPGAVIAVVGPDVRWIGTESGYGRESEWSVIPIYDTSGMQEVNKLDNVIRPNIRESDDEVGGINQLGFAKALKWYPSEVDVSIRPGWFYHAYDDNSIKSPEKLLDIYFNSIGKNSSLLLNIPPDKNGLINERDVNVLKVFHNSLQQIFDQNIARQAEITDSEFNFKHTPAKTVDDKAESYWMPSLKNSAPYLLFEWKDPVWFNVLSISEYIKYGQRVASFKLEIFENDEWVTKVSGTTVGYKRILTFPYILTQKARLIFSEFRHTPMITEVGFYHDIPQVKIDPPGKPFKDSVSIHLSTNNPEAKIYYTQNFSLPSPSKSLYLDPILLTKSSPLNAVAINSDEQSGFVKNEIFSKAKYNVNLLTTPSPEYLNEGGILLCDGVKGDLDIKSKKWLGYQDEDLEVVIDLGQSKEIRNVMVHSLTLPSASIFPPSSILISISDHDGLKPGDYKLVSKYFPYQSANPPPEINNFNIDKIKRSGPVCQSPC
jgi:alpha-L-fucosidase